MTNEKARKKEKNQKKERSKEIAIQRYVRNGDTIETIDIYSNPAYSRIEVMIETIGI